MSYVIQIPYDHRCPTLITLQCVRAFLKMVPRSKDKCGLARAGEKGAITFLALYTLWLYKFVLALGTPTPLSSAHCPYTSLGLWCGRNHGEARLPSFWTRTPLLPLTKFRTWLFFISQVLLLNYLLLILTHYSSLPGYFWGLTIIRCIWPTFPLSQHPQVA